MSTPGSQPAFPALNFIVPSDLAARDVQRLGEVQGMTLRQYAAIHAMQGLIAHWFPGETASVEKISHQAWQLADALLAAEETPHA